MQGERRVVTVVVAEVSGHDEMATALDPEEVAAALNGLLQRLGEAVARNAGEYELVGTSALQALFGLQRLREDDPFRAARTACEMQSTATLFADEVRRVAGMAPEIRIGVHTGVVAIGRRADLTAADALLAPQALDHARSLAELAPEGGILVSHETYRATRRHFKYLALSAEMPGYLLVGAKSNALAERLEGPLLGREPEMGAVQAGFAAVYQGTPVLLLVQGAAGVGKTRLTREARRSFGGTVIDATRTEFFDETRLLAMVRSLAGGEPDGQALERVLRDAGILDPGGEVPILAHFLGLPCADRGPELTPKARRERSFDLLCRIVCSRAAAGPTLLVAGDIGSADESFLAWLQALARMLSWRPDEAVALGIVAECRPGVPFAIPEEVARPRVRPVPVGPLSEEDALRLAASLLGLPAATGRWPPGLPSFLNSLVNRAQGNPLVVEELVRGLEARGALFRDGGGTWCVRGRPEDLALPTTLAGLVTSRLELLPEPQRRLLQIAAVLGREFERSVLEQVCRQPDVGGTLAGLVEAGFLVQREGDTFSFAESIACEAAYDSLLQSQREALHRVAGQVLERLEVPDELLARHFHGAGETAKAGRYYFQAGDRARLAYSNVRAREALRSALEIAREGGAAATTLPSQILPLLGEVELALGNTAAALCCWRELRLLGADRLQIRALRELGKIEEERRAAYDTAMWYFELALVMARALALPEEEAAILGAMGTVAFRRGAHADAVRLTERALGPQNVVGAQDEGLLRSVLGLAKARMGEIDPAIHQLTLSLAARQRACDEEGVLRSLNGLGAVHLEAGRLEDAEAFLLQALSLARKVADRARLAMVLNNLGEVRKWRGDHALAARHFEEIVSIYRQAGSRRGEGLALGNLGEALLALGDVVAGRERIEAALGIFEEIGYKEQHTQVLVLLAEAFGAEGALDRAREALSEARRHGGEYGSALHEAMVCRGEGVLLIRCGRGAEAVAHLERGLGLFADLGNKYEEARTRRLLDMALQVAG